MDGRGGAPVDHQLHVRRSLGRRVAGLAALAVVAAVAVGCSPLWWCNLLIGGTGFEHGAGDAWLGDEHAGIDGASKEDALRTALIEQPYVGRAQYSRLSGQCGARQFESGFRIDVGSNGQTINYVQTFGGNNRNVSTLRSARLGLYSDSSRDFDELYFFGPVSDGQQQGLVINGPNGSIRGLRSVDVLSESLDRRFVRQSLQAAIENGGRPTSLLTAVGAPARACTMLVTLTPDADSRPFEAHDASRARNGGLPGLLHWLDALKVADTPAAGLEGTGAGSEGTDEGAGSEGTGAGSEGADEGAGSGLTLTFDSWQTNDVPPQAPVGPFLDRSGIGAGFFLDDTLAAVDAAVVAAGLQGELFSVADDARGEVMECDSGQAVPDAAAVDIHWSAGLMAPDGSTTTVVGLGASPARSLAEDWSFATSWTGLTPGSPAVRIITETHAGTLRQGRLDADGQLVPGTADRVAVTDDAVIFNQPADDPAPAAYLVQTFESPREGVARRCDQHIGVAFPSRFPSSAPPAADVACQPDSTTLCLDGGRFRVDVSAGDGLVPATVLPSDDTAGVAQLGDRDETEVLIRVVNACDLGGWYWVGHASTAEGAHDVAITDTVTDAHWLLSEAPVPPVAGVSRAEWYLQALACDSGS